MLPEIFIAFQALHNHIKHIRTDTKIGFRKRDEIFTIMGINPYTVLEPHEPIGTHKLPQTISDSLPSLGNIEDNDTPSSIPFLLLFHKNSLRFHQKYPFPFFSYPCISLPISMFLERDHTLRGEPTECGLRLVVESCAFLVSPKIFTE